MDDEWSLTPSGRAALRIPGPAPSSVWFSKKAAWTRTAIRLRTKVDALGHAAEPNANKHLKVRRRWPASPCLGAGAAANQGRNWQGCNRPRTDRARSADAVEKLGLNPHEGDAGTGAGGPLNSLPGRQIGSNADV